MGRTYPLDIPADFEDRWEIWSDTIERSYTNVGELLLELVDDNLRERIQGNSRMEKRIREEYGDEVVEDILNEEYVSGGE